MFVFLSDVAAREALDLSVQMSRVDLVEPGPPDLNHKYLIVDLISEIQRLGLNLAIGESWSDTWQLVDT